MNQTELKNISEKKNTLEVIIKRTNDTEEQVKNQKTVMEVIQAKWKKKEKNENLQTDL